MATIFEISERSGLSVRTLNKLDKLGYLNATKSAEPITDAARANLKKGNKLTALQQLYLLRNDKARASLNQWQFEIDAQLDKLGDAIAEAVPWSISNAIELAARREAQAVDKIAQALFGFIQLSEHFDRGKIQDHAFIAVRLLADVPEHSLVNLSKKVQACLWQCRRSATLSDCWRLNEKGETVYFRANKKALPAFQAERNKPLANLDL
jgi:hypothetical protein